MPVMPCRINCGLLAIFSCYYLRVVLESPCAVHTAHTCYSGGMVDAGDLKSPALQQAYGFESRL